jgi:hypothetical protein
MMDATVTNGQLATHLSDLLKDEKVDTDVVETKSDDDLNVLFDEVTSLEQRVKEKALNTTALQLSKNEMTNVSNGHVETRSVSDNSVTKSEPVGSDVFAGTYSINDSFDANSSDATTNSSDANISDVKSEPVGRDVFVGTHSIGRVQDMSEGTVDFPTQTTTGSQTTASTQTVNDKSLIKVFAVNDDVYWYGRDNLEKHSRRAIYELSEEDALKKGMHHSQKEGPTKKTYFTAEELAERNKKDGATFGTTNAVVTDSGSQGTLPHTGDVPVPVPFASASMGLGAFLLAWLKKRKKKRQKCLVD